jgi:protein SCO1/2
MHAVARVRTPAVARRFFAFAPHRSYIEQMALKTVIAGAILVSGLAACSRGRAYELRGQVVAVDVSRQELTVKHEDIRGFMPGMTMPFRVRDRQSLADRTPGELIRATLVVGTNEVHLEYIERTGFAPVVDVSSPPTARHDILRTGDPVPDEEFVDQTGTPVRLSSWRKKVIAVTFIYTRCPLPDFCPLMDRNFASVQKLVAQDPLLRDRVRLMSVSFDPAHDTPAVLASHAARVGADTRSWSFVTGKREAIERFAGRFGVSVMREDKTPQEIVHNLRTGIVNGEGQLVHVVSGKDWTPSDLVTALRTAVAGE